MTPIPAILDVVKFNFNPKKYEKSVSQMLYRDNIFKKKVATSAYAGYCKRSYNQNPSISNLDFIRRDKICKAEINI